MKFKFGSFLSGFLAAALLGGLTVSALAITGKTSIEVYPINVMVNGEVFQPTDAQGHPVDVFTYKGTTYAPLRALAEAYGLEVGYDAEKKLATVTDPSLKTPEQPEKPEVPDYSDWSEEEEAAYQEFKAMWTLVKTEPLIDHDGTVYTFQADIDDDTLLGLKENKEEFVERFVKEIVGDAQYAGVRFCNENTGRFRCNVIKGRVCF